GVMLDDLVSQELREPYRLFTSRAEYRLLLRQDNADLRLTPLGHELGLVGAARAAAVERKREAIAAEIARLERTHLTELARQAGEAERLGLGSLRQGLATADLLRRPEARYGTLLALGLGDASLAPDVVEQVEYEVKYAGYLDRQQREVERLRRFDGRPLPEHLDYGRLTG